MVEGSKDGLYLANSNSDWFPGTSWTSTSISTGSTGSSVVTPSLLSGNNKEADYKVVRDLQENYVLVSNKDIKKRLVLESKLDEVKKDAEQECIKRGCDTYVYQLGEDIFFAEEKPTDTFYCS